MLFGNRGGTGTKSNNFTKIVILVFAGIMLFAYMVRDSSAVTGTPDIAKAPRTCGSHQVKLVVPSDPAKADTLANLVADDQTITGNTRKIATLNNMQPHDKLWDPDGFTCLTVKGESAVPAASPGNS